MTRAVHRRRFSPLRIVRAHPRLFVSGAIAVVVTTGLTAAARWPLPTRLLVGWDVGVALYLSLAAQAMATSTTERIRQRAAREDEGQIAMLIMSVAAAAASLAAIFAELATAARGDQHPLHLALAMATIVLSWVFIHTIFALHYAHEFYDVTAGGGMAFPGGDAEPDYWDFVYFAFVIGMTSQVSDVGITSKQIRRTAVAHGVVSFAFNTALLALTINVAAGAL